MKKISLTMQMAIGLFLGILVGILAPLIHLDTATFLYPLGQIFISLIRMVVVPLVLATIIAGAAGIHDVSKLGRVAIKTICFYFLTTGFAVIIGLILANIFEPGVGVSLATQDLVKPNVVAPSIINTLLDIVPVNPINALAQGKMLQVIFFAVMFGFALSSLGDKGQPLLRVFELLGDVMIRLTNIIMLYAPIGIFGLISYTIATHGLSVLLPLLKLILVVYLAAIVHICIVYLPLIKFTGTSLKKFFAIIAEPLLIAFTTCSSAAALPTNLQATRKLGASRAVSSFSIPLGNTLNMDGSAIYMGVVAIFAAEIYGISLVFSDQLVIILMGLLASIGTAGVPSAALIMITLVFAQINIPIEAVALVAGVDRILDMARTTLNVLGDATGALIVSKLEKDLNTDEYESSAETDVLETGTEAYKLK